MATKTLTKSQAEKIAQDIGGKVNQGSKGNYRVEYKAKGAGYKSTRYIGSLDEAPNYDAPRSNPRDPVSHETSGPTPGLRPAGSDLTYEQGAKVPGGIDPQLQRIADRDPVRADTVIGYTNSPNAVPGGAQAPVATAAATPTPTQNRYQQGLAAAQAGGVPAPVDAGAARTAAASYLPPQQKDTNVVDNIFSQDPAINQLMAGIGDLLSSKNQVPSIMDDYRRLRRSSGLDDINEELIDAETILDGTESDIRNEIQTAGGFGTESQVQAMTLSRNKNLLKRYNQLTQMKTDATNQLNTMLQLTQQDRQMAQERINTALTANFNMANFRQTALQNSRAQYQWLAQMDPIGFYNSMSQDPRQMAMAEKILGTGPGGLKGFADQKYEEKRILEEERAFNRSVQNQQLAISRGNLAVSQGNLALAREKQAAELAEGGNQELLGLLGQYRTAIQGSSWFTRTFNPEKNAEVNTLKAQITAEYKKAQELGTLDAGVQKLIDDTLGGKGIAGVSTAAQLKAIDSFTQNQGGSPYQNYKNALGI